MFRIHFMGPTWTEDHHTAHPECCLVIVVLCHKRIVWILNKRLLRINLFMILAVPFRQKPNALWTRPRRVGRPSWSEDRMWGINTRTLREAKSCCLCWWLCCCWERRRINFTQELIRMTLPWWRSHQEMGFTPVQSVVVVVCTRNLNLEIIGDPFN